MFFNRNRLSGSTYIVIHMVIDVLIHGRLIKQYNLKGTYTTYITHIPRFIAPSLTGKLHYIFRACLSDNYLKRCILFLHTTNAIRNTFEVEYFLSV